jgi:hypothetical protein
VAEGRLRTVRGELELDRRDHGDFASDGFLVRAELTRAVGGDLNLRTHTDDVAFADDFTHGLIDARVYRSVHRDATLSFRAVAGGVLTDRAAAPQFQHALGGAGSLPGYSLFSADCGARTSFTSVNNETYFGSYGCDRFALFSAEYRGSFDLHFGDWHDDGEDEDDHDWDDWHWNFDASPDWILFFDGARGWAMEQSEERGARDTDALYDVGAGILLGDLGMYVAVPLTASDRGVKFFVRLGPRF